MRETAACTQPMHMNFIMIHFEILPLLYNKSERQTNRRGGGGGGGGGGLLF